MIPEYLALWRLSHGADSDGTIPNSVVRNDEKEGEVESEVKKIVEKKDAQESANFEEVPAWAAGLMQTVKDAMRRIDDIEMKTKGGVPEVEDGQEGTAVAQDSAEGESADSGAEAARKFGEAERAETRGQQNFAGEGESPVTATKAEQERLQRSKSAGPEKSAKDPALENGVIRFNSEGQRNDTGRRDASREDRADLRGHGADKTSHHASDRMDAMYESTAAQLKEMQALMAKTLRQPTIEERNQVANARKRADSVYAACGKTTPEWLPGESPMAYRRRLADGLKGYSDALKKTVMDSLPDDVFEIAEEKVYNDASSASRLPNMNPPMQLRPHRYQDSVTGHNVTEYFGDPMAWMSPFMSPGAKLKLNKYPDKTN